MIHPRIMHTRRNHSNLSIDSIGSAHSSSSLLSPRTSLQQRSAPLTPKSPSLPSLVPRHGKRRQSPIRRARLVHERYTRPVVLLCATILAAVGYFGLCHSRITRVSNWAYPDFKQQHLGASRPGAEEELLTDGGDKLQALGTVFFADRQGRERYTISIPAAERFPLLPIQYLDLCSSAHNASKDLGSRRGAISSTIDSGSGKGGIFSSLTKRHRSYNAADPYFLDIHDAEAQGLLPVTDDAEEISYVKGGRVLKKFDAFGKAGEVCNSSLTYVLQSSDAGMGNALMQLWLAYGLARKEGRAFFVDDTNWAYGDYTTYFKPPPLPRCRPPPRTHVVPCPHNARHLVFSRATTYYTFGHAFNEEYEDPRARGDMSQVNIFGLARTGYDALFKLTGGDGDWLERRLEELNEQRNGQDEDGDGTPSEHPIISMHVRRGDRHPNDYQYSEDYLPLDRYIDAAKELGEKILAADDDPAGEETHSSITASIRKHLGQTTNVAKATGVAKSHAQHRSSNENSTADVGSDSDFAKLLISSDDPDMYDESEVTDAPADRAQNRIMLASKRDLEDAAADDADGANERAALEHASPEARTKYIDDVSGWEGGFFKSVFWALGNGRGSPPSMADSGNGHAVEDWEEWFNPDRAPDEATMSLRSLVGRSYLLDLAVLGQSADGVVCASSAMGCRILGVMLGWEDAVVKERWVNVDKGWGWRGVVW